MSDSTPVYGIVYPCGDDTIDTGIFQEFAESLDAAFVAGQAELDAATKRPTAQVYQNGLVAIAITAATDTTCTYTTEVFDNGGMANLGVNNDRLTIVVGGVYWVELMIQITGGFTTLTSQSAILQVNGSDFYRYKSRALSIAADGFAHFSIPVNLYPGDTLIGRARWTGTGGPAAIGLRRLTASLLVAH